MKDTQKQIQVQIDKKTKELKFLNEEKYRIRISLLQNIMLKRDIGRIRMMADDMAEFCQEPFGNIFSGKDNLKRQQTDDQIKKDQLFSERKLILISNQIEKVQQEIGELQQELKNSLVQNKAQKKQIIQKEIEQKEYAKQPTNQFVRIKDKIPGQQAQQQQKQYQQECGAGSLKMYQNSMEQKQTQQVFSAIPLNMCTNPIEEKCVVCLINMEEKDVVTVLKCDHCFHQKCISDWFKKSPTCPLCRKQQ